MCHPACDRAQEITPFKVLGVEGHVTSKMVRDEFVNDHKDGQQSRQMQWDLRQEVTVTTHSYVYHPNFLLLDVGGGPILQQGRFETENSRQDRRATLYNFAARATLLRDKPYRGAVYYEHLNPTVNIAPGEVINQESTRYGVEAMVLEPASPVPVVLEASRTQSSGSGALRVVDDRLDQLSVRGNYSHGALGNTNVRFIETRQSSASGSVNLPIQTTSIDSRELSADTRLGFGPDRRYEVSSFVTMGNQDFAMPQSPLPARKDFRVLVTGRGRLEGNVNTFANVNHVTSSQGTLDTALDSLVAGLTAPLAKAVQAGAGVRAESVRGNQLSARTYGVDGSMQYQKSTGLGAMQAGYAGRYTVRDQQAASPQTSVIGESLRLSGTAPSRLANARIVLSTLVVSNPARTQTYVEGLDYTVTVIGTQTRIQRLIGGAILDGQDLLVDYAYDNGGTFGYAQFDNSVNLGWNPTRVIGLNYRYSDSRPRVTSGTPSSPLNQVRDHTLGARADLPVKLGIEMNVGASYEIERRQETVSPYRRKSADAYVEAIEPLFQRGTIRVTVRNQQLDYANSPLGTNLTGYDVHMATRLDSGVDILADMTRERDQGGLVTRSRNTEAVKALWRYRRFSLSAEFGRSRETQGDTTRQRTLIQFFLRREFGA